MNLTADPIQGRENMIKRLNKFILSSIMGIRLRPVGAVFLGGCAGLSLTANIIPSAMTFMGVTDSFSARWGIGGYAVYSVLAWSVGGWAAQRTGSRKLGAVVLGSVGLASGLLFTATGLGTEMNALVTGGGAALLYGAIGGMIIGEALGDIVPITRSDKARHHSDKKEGMDARRKGCKSKTAKESGIRLFQFFR